MPNVTEAEILAPGANLDLLKTRLAFEARVANAADQLDAKNARAKTIEIDTKRMELLERSLAQDLTRADRCKLELIAACLKARREPAQITSTTSDNPVNDVMADALRWTHMGLPSLWPDLFPPPPPAST